MGTRVISAFVERVTQLADRRVVIAAFDKLGRQLDMSVSVVGDVPEQVAKLIRKLIELVENRHSTPPRPGWLQSYVDVGFAA